MAFDPKRTFEDDAYALEVPYDVDVTDLRLGYSYHNDPWWPEAGDLLRTRFDWPQADLLPLHRLGTPADSEVVGRRAPPFRVAEWIGGNPGSWNNRKGKVTLVAFLGPGDRDLLAPLRRVHELFGPAGLEIVLVHFPTDLPLGGSAGDVRRMVAEFRLPFPVAIDRPSADGPRGVTGESFGIEGVPYAFLVDRHGIVRSAGQASYPDVDQLRAIPPLLKEAGESDVPDIGSSFDVLSESRRLSVAMVDALEDGFRQWLAETPFAGQVGEVRGTITDRQGQPVAGAKVEARLTLIVLIFADPGGYQQIPSPRSFSAVTDEQGRYAIPGLTKGTYLLRITAPGHAWRQERASIGPDLKPVTLDIALDQGDAIAGRVIDKDGRPIALATVTPVKRHFEQNGNTVWTTSVGSQIGPRMTDDAGRFRFKGLERGRYTFEVEAKGFETATIEEVLAGTDGVEVTLRRTGSP